MFQRDYIMRMIEGMAQVSATILGLRKAGKQEEALQVVEELLDRQFGMNGRLLKSLSEDDLVRMLSRSGDPDPSLLLGLGLLLREEASVQDDLGHESAAFHTRLRALHLLLRASSYGAEPSPDGDAERLLGELSAYELPPDSKRRIAAWREEQGRYDRAEDLWYELHEDGRLEPGELGRFYGRLQHLTDESLERGGLSRQELLEAAKPWLAETGKE
ncbi:DUF6483 family protein [Paenibacillus pasadenensis]|uniref:DUF6483 family protein n=1 Tax=Paenibacillus TaxID=44249 RepID=UPI00040EC389|nr:MULTISPECIES: DUF6483 family protein [Paenibacillus]QGG57650.1 hypothetical protein GE073_19985 [Paenibacillus sp. B01]